MEYIDEEPWLCLDSLDEHQACDIDMSALITEVSFSTEVIWRSDMAEAWEQYGPERRHARIRSSQLTTGIHAFKLRKWSYAKGPANGNIGRSSKARRGGVKGRPTRSRKTVR